MAETFRLFSTQMYVSPVGNPANSMRSIEQRSAVADRGLGMIPLKRLVLVFYNRQEPKYVRVLFVRSCSA